MSSQAAPREGLVSCVIIFLNAERYLEEAIDSVLAQTYPYWELLLVDDGSTDSSAKIARRYAVQYDGQVRVFAHPGGVNLGKSASRNLGMREARGEFLAMLDADDVWLPEKLEQQVAVLRAQPRIDMVYGPVRYWYSWTGRPSDRFMDVPSRVGLPASVHSRVFEPPTLLTEMLLFDARRYETICPYPSAVIFRRELFASCGGFDEDFRDLYDDVVFFAKAFIRARIHVCDRVWALYRTHSDEQFSVSYASAIEAGTWHPTDANPSERKFLDRTAAHVRASGAGHNLLRNARLRAVLWYALLRYRSPNLFRILLSLHRARRGLSRRARIVFAGRSDRGVKVRVQSGSVRWGDFIRLQPMDDRAGFCRGVPVRNHYVALFLNQYRSKIRGRVIELGDDVLARKYGGARVQAVTVLAPSKLLEEYDAGEAQTNPTWDCLIAVDAVQYSDDPRAAVAAIRRRLAPGGTAFVALPGLVPLTANSEDRWRFTPFAALALFETEFPADAIKVQPYGNVRVAAASLHGLGGADLDEATLAYQDDAYPVLVMVAATRPDSG